MPGVVIGAAIAYPVAWLLMPDEKAPRPVHGRCRLTTSATNRKLAGVCGGLGEYFGVDPTAVRVLWVVLSVFPGFIVGGAAAYLLACLVMPALPVQVTDASEAETRV
uniref:Putative stress-responsive transcriptional regulator n=1 Tax=uncultured Gemmatimonadales bacterium HF0770_11C06 TaxID=723616 RepID=E7C6Z3_9BACT|nr:putative stress-responsive transcriptional regulator [uncultured Gemmatimonadales bacterium HF0770_11C06]